MNNNSAIFKEISSSSFYCIKPPYTDLNWSNYKKQAKKWNLFSKPKETKTDDT